MSHHPTHSCLWTQEGFIKEAVSRLGKVETGKVWLLTKTWRDVHLPWTNHPGSWNACEEPGGWEIQPERGLGIKARGNTLTQGLHEPP